MRIAVNALCIIPESTSQLGRFTTGLIQALTIHFPQHEFFIFLQKPEILPFKLPVNAKVMVQKLAGKHPLLSYWWFQVRLPKTLRRIKADVFLSPDGLTTLKSPAARVTLVGAGMLGNGPVAGNVFTQKYWQHNYRITLRESERLVTFSEHSRQQLLNQAQVNQKQISVVLPAANRLFKVIPFGQQVKVREKFVLGEAYYLLPELPMAEESFELVLNAFRLVKQRTGNDLKLVIAGRKVSKNLNTKVKGLLKDLPGSLLFTGPLTAPTLAGLYGAAVATLYFPVADSLNLPILEAQQAGCPVIAVTSENQSPVTLGGMINVLPFQAENLFQALVMVYHDLDFRAKLIQAGKENAALFTWEKSSRQIMQVLAETYKAGKNAAAPV